MPRSSAAQSAPAIDADPAPAVAAAPARPARASRGRARQPRPVAPVALGSLTQPGSRSGESCGRCGSARTTTLSMTLTDGTPVLFRSCHTCEHRSWTSADGELDRDTVLERTRKIR